MQKYYSILIISGLSDIEVIKAVEDLKNEKKYLKLENMVFERFLKKNDPVLITGLLLKI